MNRRLVSCLGIAVACAAPARPRVPPLVAQEPTIYLPLPQDVRRQVASDFRAHNPGTWGIDLGNEWIGVYKPVLYRAVRGGVQGPARDVTPRAAIERARTFLVHNARFFGLTAAEAAQLAVSSEPVDRAPEGPLLLQHRQGEWRNHTYVMFEGTPPWSGTRSFPELDRTVEIDITIGVDGEVTRFVALGVQFLPPRFAAVPVGDDDLALARRSLQGERLVHRWKEPAPPSTPPDTPGFTGGYGVAWITREQPLPPVTASEVQAVEACVHTPSPISSPWGFMHLPCLRATIAKGPYRFDVRIDRRTGVRLDEATEVGST